MKKFISLLAVILLICSSALAVVQPGEDFYYLDTANVLGEEAEGTIFFCNQLLEQKSGAQIVIAALDSIDGEDIYDYAYDVFNEWGIGSAEENNGLLLLLAIEEDNYYALSGAGVDRILSSSVLQEYLDEELEPDFAAKNYEAGVMRFFEAVLDRYADYYNIDLSVQDGAAAYEAYIAENASSADFGGAHGGGAGQDGPTSVWQPDAYDHRNAHDDGGDFLSTIIGILLVIFVLSFIFGRRRGGGVFFMPVFRGRPYHHHAHHHRPSMHRHSAPRRAPPRSGGFGGSAGRSSFGGGRSGFGGARGGGGRSFGGGAGRGR